MKTIGIISEYNPFHNGHKYHIEASKAVCEAEYAVCVMSGSFVQRGEPSIFDKWARAEMAVKGGADLVIELPLVYACQPAEIFAFGAVKLLNALGIIDFLCFGSEFGDTEPLKKIAEVLYDEPAAFREGLRVHLDAGMTYPKAVSLALGAYLQREGIRIGENIIDTPNNLLGIEYIKSLMLLDSPIVPRAVKRIVSDYNDTEITHAIASATAVRREIKNQGLSEKVSGSVPESAFDIIERLISKGQKPVYLNDFSDLLLYRLRGASPEQLRGYLNIKEGIEFRLKKFADTASDCEELIEKIKTKRYTRTFIQRLLCHILLDIRLDDVLAFKAVESPLYVRVLSFNDKGKYLLKQMKERCPYPIITKVANFRSEDGLLNRLFHYDTLATDIYSLAYDKAELRRAGADFYRSPVYGSST